MRQLREQLVVVTGASAGIGLACARAFVQEGSRVLLVARGQQRLEMVCEELGAHATAVVADIGTDEGMQRVLSLIHI